MGGHDPQVNAANYNFTGGSGIVDQNANELWTVLVCKPWLDGEFGTTVYTTAKGAKPTVVNQYGRQLLWSQAIATNENPTASLIQAKQDAYAGIAQSIKQNDPDVYSLFQGNQYPTRLEIAFASLFAALVAGVLVLLIAITLIILKLGFLLLLVAGPFFLIVGTHPGFGRVVALRWVEMLVGVLLKQAAVALVLSILLYAYSLIMGTSDAVLPWALKILMIALVTVAVFIYRKPFVHLFSAVGYGMVGSRDRAEAGLAQAGSLARRNTLDAASVGVPGFAAYRAARWARRNPAQAAGVAATVATAGAAGAAAAGASAASAATAGGQDGAEQPGAPGDESSDEAHQGGSGRSGLAARGRGRAAAAAEGGARAAPPLDLPDRDAAGQPRSPSGWARSGAADAAAGRARPDAPGGRAGAPSGAVPSGGAPAGGAPAGGAPAGRASGAPAGAPGSGGSVPGAPGSRAAALAGRRAAATRRGAPAVRGQRRAGPGRGPADVRVRPVTRWRPGTQRGAHPGQRSDAQRGAAGWRSWAQHAGTGCAAEQQPGRRLRLLGQPITQQQPGPGAVPERCPPAAGPQQWLRRRPGRRLRQWARRRPVCRAALRRRSGRTRPGRGDQAGGGQGGPGADSSPPGPFWLRPVRRKK